MSLIDHFETSTFKIFVKNILSSDLSVMADGEEFSSDVTLLVEKYNNVLRELLDRHAPKEELRPHAPLYNKSLLRDAKRKRRQLERKWVKLGL